MAPSLCSYAWQGTFLFHVRGAKSTCSTHENNYTYEEASSVAMPEYMVTVANVAHSAVQRHSGEQNLSIRENKKISGGDLCSNAWS
jgi:hypothetical protein